jgi:hypothetical protein
MLLNSWRGDWGAAVSPQGDRLKTCKSDWNDWNVKTTIHTSEEVRRQATRGSFLVIPIAMTNAGNLLKARTQSDSRPDIQ